MKIKNIALFCFLSLSITGSSYANTSSVINKFHGFMEKHAAEKEIAQDLTEKYSNDTTKKLAKKGAKRILLNSMKKGVGLPLATAKFVYKHPLISATVGAGAAGFYFTTVSHAINVFAEDPTGFEDYLNKNPEKIDEISEKVIDKYNKANDESQQDKYEILLNSLEYDLSDPILKTATDQEDLEKTKNFAIEYSKLEKIADEYDRNHFKECKLKDALRMVKDTPLKFRKYNESIALPDTRDSNNLSKEYSISQYSRLKGKMVYKNASMKGIDEQLSIERDHIPSYKALELFFLKKYPNILTEKKIKDRYANLNSNASVINLRYGLHRENRTTGKRNEIFSIIDSVDFLSLRIATIKDYATILVLNLNNQAEYKKLLDNFELLYARNKELCIYDI